MKDIIRNSSSIEDVENPTFERKISKVLQVRFVCIDSQNPAIDQKTR